MYRINLLYTYIEIKELEENDSMNRLIASYQPQGTPSFYIMEDGKILEEIRPPEPDIGQILLDNIGEYV